MADTLPGALGKQVGPLPLGAWLAVIGAGLGLGYYRRHHATTPTAVATTDPTVLADTTTNAGVGGYAGPAPIPAVIADPVPSVGTPMRVPPATNEQWAQQAVAAVVAYGGSPTFAALYIQSWLNGQYGGPAQTYTVDLATRAIGPPPVLPTFVASSSPTTSVHVATAGDTVVLPPTTSRQNAPAAPSVPAFHSPGAAVVAPAGGPKGCAAVTPGPASFGYLRSGSRGGDVVRLQNALRAHGNDPGASDGVFGARTKAAVASAQTACGLTADGMVGAQTACCLGL